MHIFSVYFSFKSEISFISFRRISVRTLEKISVQNSVGPVPITFALQALEEYSMRMKAFIESYQNGVFSYQINSWSNLVSYINIFMKWHSYNSWHQVRFLIY